MKAARQRKIPLPFCIFISAVLVCGAICLTDSFILPEKLVYTCIYSVMPDALTSELQRIARSLLSDYGGAGFRLSGQKSGSMNDFYSDVRLSDLSATPDYILDAMKSLQDDFLASGYLPDGDVSEITYTTEQSTDNYGVISVRNVTEDAAADIEKRLSEPFSLPVSDLSEPVVLIYHTHTTESYIPFDNGTFSSAYPERNSDENANMLRVGDELCAVLEANGIKAIHDRNIYDEQYNGAYDRSREGIEKILRKYPSIVITLDIHRDAIYYNDTTRIKPVTVVNGRKAAQLMIIAGARGGNVTEFPQWDTNFAFALRLQQTANNKYNKLMKPIYFCNRKYNMDITPYSLLIEVGTDVNTLEEATHSARLLGDCMAMLIKEYKI